MMRPISVTSKTESWLRRLSAGARIANSRDYLGDQSERRTDQSPSLLRRAIEERSLLPDTSSKKGRFQLGR